MTGVRTVRPSVGAAIGLIALTSFLVPAAAVGQQERPNPGIGPEYPVADPVPGTPQGYRNLAVASGGGIHLVVMSGVAAVRVDREATIIDPSPIPVSDRASLGDHGTNPDVAFDGENFLVVWEAHNLTGNSVRARRVSPEGQLLDAEEIVVSPAPGNSLREPRISFDGTNFLVVWYQDDGIHRALVSPDGTIVDPARRLVATGVAQRLEVAFNGSNHLVVWDTWPPSPQVSVRGTLVSPDGAALHPGGFPISASPEHAQVPSVAALGSTFLVAWSDDRGEGLTDIHGARVDAGGTVLDPAGIPLATTPADEWWPQLASDGTNFFALWNGRATRVAPSGAVLDPAGIALPEPIEASGTALGFDGEGYFAVSDDRGVNPRGETLPLGVRITTGGVVLDPDGFTLVVAANLQSDVVTAFDGTNTFVVWRDDRFAGPGIYGARVDPDGHALDGAGFRISDGAYSPNASVGFDGTTFLVAWREVRADTNYIRVARVSQAGVVLDRFDVGAGESPGNELIAPTVASGDGVHLVAWLSVTHGSPIGTTSDLVAARVGPDGTVLDPAGILVAEQANDEYDIALGDAGFLFVWLGVRDAAQDIQGTLVTTAGTVPNPDGFAVSNTSEDERDPQVAWNGTTYLVVWATNGGDRGIHGARVDGSGAVLDPDGIPIANGHGQEVAPTVAANGPFLVTWIYRRRVSTGFKDDFVATRVDPDGTVANPGGYPIGVEDFRYPLAEPVLGATPSEGDFFVTYVRTVEEQPFGSDRAFVRTISPK